jgi:septal ring factor EnvC (AmiA/AmiB activator)
MDRNLTERLKKLSKELADAQHEILQTSKYNEEELNALDDRIADLQDEIWDIEDQIREQAENEYDDNTAKGWN